MNGLKDWVWDLSIPWEQGECWMCICVWVVVVYVKSV